MINKKNGIMGHWNKWNAGVINLSVFHTIPSFYYSGTSIKVSNFDTHLAFGFDI
jgi:hypothetical protein